MLSIRYGLMINGEFWFEAAISPRETGFVSIEAGGGGLRRRIRKVSDRELAIFRPQKSPRAVQKGCREGHAFSESKSLDFHNFAHSEMLGDVGTLQPEITNLRLKRTGFLLEKFFKYADPAKY